MKSIFTSKTFWLNILGAAAIIANAVPPKYGVPALSLLNIGNRFLTTGSVNLLG